MADSEGESQPLISRRSSLRLSDNRFSEEKNISSSNDNVKKAREQMRNDECPTPHGTSNIDTIAHLMKAHLGMGILAMPCAFSQSGILVGTLGLIVLCALSVHCMHLIVKCSDHLCSKVGVTQLDYAGVAAEAFRAFSPRLYRCSSTARNVVNVFQMLIQLGCCCTYILFVSRNIQFIVMKLMGNVGKDCDPHKPMILQLYELCVTVLLILLVFIRNMRHLALFSTLANLAVTLGLAVIMYDILFQEGLKSISNLPLFNGWNQLALYFGTVLFAFGGISLILPLKSKMKDPEAFTPWFGVINVSMALACILQITMGFYGYLAFGDKSAASITLNLASWYGLAIQLIFSFSVFVTYGIQFFSPMDIIGDTFTSTRLAQRIGPNTCDYLLRASLVLMTYLVVAIVDRYLDLLIALVGSFSSAAAVLIFPPVLEIITFWPIRAELKHYWVMFLKDCAVTLFGFLGLITGTFVAMQKLIINLTSNDITGACPPAF